MPEPLGLEILAACVPDCEIELLDMRLDPDVKSALERFAPDVVALTALTTEVDSARSVMAETKALADEIFTVVGGHHATLLPEDFFRPYVDAICLGEGEEVFPELVRQLAGQRRLRGVPNLIWRDEDGRFVNNGRHYEKIDADTIPMPRRDLVEKYRSEYFILFDQPDSSISSGRGCPYRCNFCSVWQFYNGQVRQMSPGRVIEEVQSIETRHICFVDDNFLLNYRREMEIAERIKAEGIDHEYSMQCRTDSVVRHPNLVTKWTDVGLSTMLLGLEGATDAMLRDVNKKSTARTNDKAIQILHDHGIVIWAAFIVGLDWTADDFKRLKDYVAEKELAVVQYTVLTPLPGTELYSQYYDDLLTHDYRHFDVIHAVLPTKLPREEFYQHVAGLYGQSSLKPWYDLVESGKLTMADLRRRVEVVKKMSSWEFYVENDPVLGGHLEASPHGRVAVGGRIDRPTADLSGQAQGGVGQP